MQAGTPGASLVPPQPAGRGIPRESLVTGVTVRVPAKLNLQLAVGPPRGDGYHDLVPASDLKPAVRARAERDLVAL